MDWKDRLINLFEEDFTSKKARKTAVKGMLAQDAADKAGGDEVKRSFIRTGKRGGDGEADSAAFKRGRERFAKSDKAPASARRVMAARDKIKSIKVVGKKKFNDDTGSTNTTGRSFFKRDNQNANTQKQRAVRRAGNILRTAAQDPMDKSDRTIQKVMDRETRASQLGVGPKRHATQIYRRLRRRP